VAGLVGLLPILILIEWPQSVPVPGPVPDRPEVTIRVERRAERFEYHIENPSTFEPGPPVPHFFEQVYESGSAWFLVDVTYRLLGAGARTEVGITPRFTAPGSDIDTFFQPSGEIITSGTRGDVRLRAFSIRQWMALGDWHGWTFGATLGYRRSEMDFLPSDRIVTRSLPPSDMREPVGGDETTWSHVVDSGITASRSTRRSERWHVRADVEALPITRARLAISLPLKYPGQLIRQDAFGFGARARLSIERRLGPATAGAAFTVGGAWGYRRAADYDERRAGGEIFVRLSRR
jgi:hypothetical protein